MAPPRKLPAIETSPGFKTTTVRMPNAQFEQIDMFCNAMGISMTEFLRKAALAYAKKLAADPELRKSIQKQITRQQRQLEKMASALLGDGVEPEGDDDEEEADDD